MSADAHLTSLAETMRRQNCSLENLWAMLLEANDKCEPPLSDVAVLQIAERHAPGKEAQAEAKNDGKPRRPFTRFPSICFDDITLNTTVEYLVKGVLERGLNAEVYGPSGDGKTFFTLDLLLHVALGIPWRDKKVRQGLVVYVAAEAGASIARRFVAWRNKIMGEARSDLTPFIVLTRGPNLLDLVEVAELMADLKNISEFFGMPISVVAFDTLSRSAPGAEENGSRDMSLIVAAADGIRTEFGAATLFVHHSGKDVSKGGRGHTALLGACDVIICVVDKAATVEKVRDGESGETFTFKLNVINLGTDQDGEPISSCVVEPTTSATKLYDVKLTDAEKIAFATLKEAISSFGETMPATSAIPNGARAVEVDTWRSAFLRGYGEDKVDVTAKKAFVRAKTKLIGSQLVGVSMPYVWIWR